MVPASNVMYNNKEAKHTSDRDVEYTYREASTSVILNLVKDRAPGGYQRKSATQYRPVTDS